MSWATSLPTKAKTIAETLKRNNDGPKKLLKELRSRGHQVYLKDNQLAISPKVTDPNLRGEIVENKDGLLSLLRVDPVVAMEEWKKDWLATIGELHIRYGNIPEPEDQIKFAFLVDLHIESFRVIRNAKDWQQQKAHLKGLEASIVSMGLEIPTLEQLLNQEAPF